MVAVMGRQSRRTGSVAHDPSQTPRVHRSTCRFVLDFERPANVK
jgi:hypothetical protein